MLSAWYLVPWSQILDTFCPERKVALRSTLGNLRCSKISIGRVSAEEPGIMSLSARVSVPSVVLRSLLISIGPYKSSESAILRCGPHKGGTRGKLEEAERHGLRSIPIKEDLLYSRH
jgi:hypothetical protein